MPLLCGVGCDCSVWTPVGASASPRVGDTSPPADCNAPEDTGSAGGVISATASTTVTTSPADACTVGAASAACCCSRAAWNDGSDCDACAKAAAAAR